MLAGFPLDHVGIAVPAIAEARGRYEPPAEPGVHPPGVIELPDEGVNALFLGPIELLEPRGEDSPVARFLASRGPGLHHIAFRVPSIPELLPGLRELGYRPVRDEPRVGAAGHPILFLHPASAGGVLVELVER